MQCSECSASSRSVGGRWVRPSGGAQKNSPPAPTAEEDETWNTRKTLPLIFPRAMSSRARGRNWHLSPAGGGSSGCQGFTGPAPSTLLDELTETSFHRSVVPARFRGCSMVERKRKGKRKRAGAVRPEAEAETEACRRRTAGRESESGPAPEAERKRVPQTPEAETEP